MILNIFKIGGSIVDNAEVLASFTARIATIEGYKIIVHGGGKTASRMCEDLGIEVQMHEGRRITNEETLPIVIMTYAGLVNKNVVASLQAVGVNAVGLSGVDGNTIKAHKRHMGVINADIDYGYAGDIDRINPDFLFSLLLNNFIPVVAPLSHDGRGQLLNTNADTIAAHIAASLSESYDVQLYYLLDHPGVMRDLEDAASTIAEIKLSELDSLQSKGLISAGMIPKLRNAEHALKHGATAVYLTNIEGLSCFPKCRGTKIIED